MEKLNLPPAEIRKRIQGGVPEIFDEVRRKYVVLTSEEWVRQHFVHYLMNYLNVPLSLIAVEKSLKLNRMMKRADILVYGKNTRQLLMVECKAPQVKISQKVFDQVARYNIALKVPFLAVTNGMEHFCIRIDFRNKSYSFCQKIPDFDQLEQLANSD